MRTRLKCRLPEVDTVIVILPYEIVPNSVGNIVLEYHCPSGVKVCDLQVCIITKEIGHFVCTSR